MMKFIAWLLTFLFAFSLGSGAGNTDKATNSELAQKVQAHMDVIVDESAAMVDDVVEEIRKDEHVQDAEAFVEDVGEIIDNTRDDIKAHFGKADEEAVEDAAEEQPEVEEAAPETAEEAEAGAEDAGAGT